MTEQIITRLLPFECRADDDGDGLTLEGYAAVFDRWTLIDSWEGRFKERIARGAFAKTIRETTPVLQFDHGQHPLIGSIPLGVIRSLREDEHGLHVRAVLSDNWLVEPVRDAIRDGAVNGMSFRFRPIIDDWEDDGDVPLRTLREVAMPELGPVVFPAYKSTEVGVRDEDINLLVARMESRLRGRPSTPGGAVREDTPADGAAPDDEPADEATRVTQAQRRQRYRRLFGTTPEGAVR